MRKARKKAVSILVALTFLLGLVLAYAGPAMADTTYANFTGTYRYVVAGENQQAGSVTVTEKTYNTWAEANVDEVYVTLTLPSGVEFQTKPVNDSTKTGYYTNYVDTSITNAVYSFVDGDKNLLKIKIDPDDTKTEVVQFKFNVENASKLKIASGVTGDIKASVEVMGVKGDDIVFVESDSVLIARVEATKSVSVTAGTPKVIEAGTTATAADITIKESIAKALSTSDVVYLQIETPDATFESVSLSPSVSGMTNSTATVVTDDKDLAWFDIKAQSGALPAKIVVTPKLAVPPSVSGDIQITVYSSYANSKLEKTTVTVARVGTVSASVDELKDNDGIIYAGQKGTLDASFKLKAASGTKMLKDKTIILELSAGKFDTTSTPVSADGANYQGTYNDGKTAWFTVASDTDTVKFSNFAIKAAGDAAEADIVVKISGTAGASGEAVIGKIKKPFTVTADKPTIKALATAQPAGDIVITEAGAGAIIGGANLYLKLPEGVTFEGTPSVKVTSGNISLGTASVNSDGDLEIPVKTKSGIASTIKVSGIKYNVGRLALDGDVEVKIVGEKGTGKWLDDKVLAKVANATIQPAVVVAPTKREASFVIGSTTYKVNGKDSTMDVAPYIDAASGRTYLPVRYVAYALGVSEDNIFYSNGVVSLLKDGRAVQMTIGSKALVVNGVTITMDAAPVIKDGRTMLPFRWIATALGASVKWDEATKTVTMTIE